MPHAVQCPDCRGFSRVGDDALGLVVACPHCQQQFTAEVPRPPRRRDDVPTFAPVRRPARPAAEVPGDLEADAPPRHVPGVVGLALLPLGVPLAWLVAPLLGLREPVFSFAAPVALALGAVGLGLGISYAGKWSPAARVRSVVLLVLVAYLVGGLLFFVTKEWAVVIRRHLPTTADKQWETEARPGAFEVKLPGRLAPLSDAPLPGWEEQVGGRCAPGEGAPKALLHVVYEVAAGKPAAAMRDRGLTDAEWFALVKAALADSTGGTVTRDEAVPEIKVATKEREKQYLGREYTVELPDAGRHRVVRVIRDKSALRVRAFYLAVEGAFLNHEVPEVGRFFNSFTVLEPGE